MVKTRRLALQRLLVDAARELHQLEGIEVALPAQAVGVDRLVRQGQHVEQGVEVADRGMDVDRLDRIAAPQMNGVERLSEPDEVPVVGMVAGAPAAFAVERIGGGGNGAEGHVAVADHEIAGGVARMQREALGRQPDDALDQRGIEAHALRNRPRHRRRRS